MAIKLKSKSVIFTELTPSLAYILYALERFHRSKRVPQPVDLIITSMNDSSHSVNSRHYRNEAIDIRSKNFSDNEEKEIFRKEFELTLGPFFTVILENLGRETEHFHVQVKKGLSFP